MGIPFNAAGEIGAFKDERIDRLKKVKKGLGKLAEVVNDGTNDGQTYAERKASSESTKKKGGKEDKAKKEKDDFLKDLNPGENTTAPNEVKGIINLLNDPKDKEKRKTAKDKAKKFNDELTREESQEKTADEYDDEAKKADGIIARKQAELGTVVTGIDATAVTSAIDSTTQKINYAALILGKTLTPQQRSTLEKYCDEHNAAVDKKNDAEAKATKVRAGNSATDVVKISESNLAKLIDENKAKMTQSELQNLVQNYVERLALDRMKIKGASFDLDEYLKELFQKDVSGTATTITLIEDIFASGSGRNDGLDELKGKLDPLFEKSDNGDYQRGVILLVDLIDEGNTDYDDILKRIEESSELGFVGSDEHRRLKAILLHKKLNAPGNKYKGVHLSMIIDSDMTIENKIEYARLYTQELSEDNYVDVIANLELMLTTVGATTPEGLKIKEIRDNYITVVAKALNDPNSPIGYGDFLEALEEYEERTGTPLDTNLVNNIKEQYRNEKFIPMLKELGIDLVNGEYDFEELGIILTTSGGKIGKDESKIIPKAIKDGLLDFKDAAELAKYLVTAKHRVNKHTNSAGENLEAFDKRKHKSRMGKAKADYIELLESDGILSPEAKKTALAVYEAQQNLLDTKNGNLSNAFNFIEKNWLKINEKGRRNLALGLLAVGAFTGLGAGALMGGGPWLLLALGGFGLAVPKALDLNKSAERFAEMGVINLQINDIKAQTSSKVQLLSYAYEAMHHKNMDDIQARMFFKEIGLDPESDFNELSDARNFLEKQNSVLEESQNNMKALREKYHNIKNIK